ncbi:excinuclease ABC subunit UvrA [Thiomonas sp.]|uniref:excinuclease ABC subunit UvrA n=1 Tax=Thiomonas sp. TaxID=2047785 RepID=UPI0026194194|nr:excinuclease ABC subunit UvrA [Thiomonas sp.]
MTASEPTPAPASEPGSIELRGAHQNNLKNLDLSIPLGQIVVVTGVSGSGKSSLAFDTVYAEGQRRYVETFSPYARQFLDRMDRPRVDHISGILPAIAIDQTNPVRTSRSTVATMTELADHLKLLYARRARLVCRRCADEVRRDDASSIAGDLRRRAAAAGDPRLVLSFPVPVPGQLEEQVVLDGLAAQGYTRVHARSGATLYVVQDRFRAGGVESARLLEAIEAALQRGQGRVAVWALADGAGASDAPGAPELDPAQAWRYSADLHCARCDISYRDPSPGLFSFNSALGACETCRGFGRTLGVDWGLVIPDASKTLRGGAVKPWQTASFKDAQRDLERHAAAAGVRLDVPWGQMEPRERDWVIDGDPRFSGKWETQYYGVRRFFEWLETRTYKMHVRVLLSKYRSSSLCPACGGARLKLDGLLWRVGSEQAARASGAQRLRPQGVEWSEERMLALPGLNLHEVMQLPVARAFEFFGAVEHEAGADAATRLLLDEIRARLRYLLDVGLGYLSLDRQSRTLSGGEVQRINLTTALGTSLTQTLFVLDEPSIGLHPRDLHRLNAVLQGLKSAGNSLLVVEHDPQIMLAADHLIELGPGAGEHGGHVVFQGGLDALRRADTLTGAYLRGERTVRQARTQRRLRRDADGTLQAPRLILEGARQHNLRDLTVEFPLHALVAVTGVSGCGKSTLVGDVLWPALARALGKSAPEPGAHARLLGAEQVTDVVLVDQTALGKTARSNPVSFVGAFDALRKRFAALPEAQRRGYTAGTFSFNSGDGRCPTCGGSGFEHVEMQFLSDVYLRCPDCDGRRYRAEVLELRLDLPGGRSLNVADVLELTVAEALQLFAGERDLQAGLRALQAVGLDYLRLGQPTPTLSGGEAQRLKLAAFLAEARRSAGRGAARGSLFLLDEPTTGLHFDDIARLLRALHELVDAGHSVVLIEHNLDVIAASDWVIDLGPEGGDGGGTLVVAGPPDAVETCAESHTGQALRAYRQQVGAEAAEAAAVAAAGGVPMQPGAAQAADNDAQLLQVAEEGGAYLAQALRRGREGFIAIRRAREHNLRNVDVDLPRGGMTVITGVSGSGKSSLAFDVLFSEGQRRYLESINAYARQFVQPPPRPDVDAIFGIPPTVAIAQRTSRGGRKSTVGTLTEVHPFLRLLYAKLGTQYCPDCQVPIAPQTEEAICAQLMRELRGQSVGLMAPLVVQRKGVYTELAQWAARRGHGHLWVDGAFLPTEPWPRPDRFREHDISLPLGEVDLRPENLDALRKLVHEAVQLGKGVVQVIWPLERLRQAMASGDVIGAHAALELRRFSTLRACPSCARSFPELDPRQFSYNSSAGWCPACFGTGAQLAGFQAEHSGEEGGWGDVHDAAACPQCAGARLNPVSLAVRWRERPIQDLSALAVDDALEWFSQLSLQPREQALGRDLVAEILSRLHFLRRVGLGYLAMDRAAPTLSGGEAQRIRLAAQLGSNLRGVAYVLDEPTIGLHPRDNLRLLDALDELRARGSTLVVVEHDEDTIRRADTILDIGPGAGRLGGTVVAMGNLQELMRHPDSLTARYLREPLRHPLVPRPATGARAAALDLRGAHLHNLRDVDVRFPRGRLSVLTGVSGSGKSSLARGVLFASARALLSGEGAPVGCKALLGLEGIERVLEVDQTPIGKTPRSCPATYVGIWDDIRKLFADTVEARMRGFAAARFSFNTGAGRCPTCEGQGAVRVEMNFLPDVIQACEDCRGLRFNPETLQVRLRGLSAGEVLELSVDAALEFFAAHPRITRALQLLHDVGLGYLRLGQPSPQLSGGEAQRLKLVTELATSSARPTLYVLDEPTVGLHMADVDKLIRVLLRLADAGHTVVVIEHNLDLMASSDWIVDLGPEGGSGGGALVRQGTPADFVLHADTGGHTALALGRFMREHGRAAQAESEAG